MKYKPLKLTTLSVFLTAVGFLCSPVLQAEPSAPSPEPSALPIGEYASFQPEGDIRRFIGETLLIDISFLWFENAASARIKLYEKNGVIYSTLEAETKGFIGFFTSYRKHFYKATFEVLDNGNRFRSKRFERRVTVGDEVDQTNHNFDYDTHTHWWQREINGKLIKSGSEDIPRGINFDDILAVFYNFRNGSYGKVLKGARYTIHTIPEKGLDKIQVHILTPDEQNDFMSLEGRKNGEELLLKAIIPKEIFQTATGELLFWISKHLIPLETTVKDYILFGDLHAKLINRTLDRQAPSGISKVPAGKDACCPATSADPLRLSLKP